MKRMLINKVFRALYWGEFSFVDGDFYSDIFKTQDFKVFTNAMKFLDRFEMGGQIEEVLIFNKFPKEEVVKKWEYDSDGAVLISEEH